MTETTKNNPLSIRLTESAVFLRSDGTGRRRDDHRPSLLRGLLTLELAKPTRITSIDIELQAKSTTAWPEGIGARRVEINEEHKIFHAATIYFRAGKTSNRRNASVGPGAIYSNSASIDHLEERDNSLRNQVGVVIDHEPPGRDTRRLSADSSYFQRLRVSHEEVIPPTPPYSAFTTYPSSPSSEAFSGFENPARRLPQTFGDNRDPLTTGILNRSRSTGLPSSTSGATSIVFLPQDSSLSRRPSIENVPEDEPGPSNLGYPSYPSSAPPSRTTSRPSTPPPNEHRGRRNLRFSLSSVSSVLMDAVRSRSPRTRHASERPGDEERGRTNEKGKYAQSPSTSIARESKERSTLGKFGGILKLDHDEPGSGDGWKEFKKGIYTYPISFEIPANSPPTLQCSYGAVTWRLRATVHRPGTFKSKFTAFREVVVVTCPTEEDTEDTENIIVERHWDHQLQYIISVSGRSFYIGGTVPMSFTLMPLAKVKIYRISVFIEERVDYYTHMKRVARSDLLAKIELLSLKDTNKPSCPILPLDSDDINVLEGSPLFVLATPGEDLSEMASSLMGPGPWTFHKDLRLPKSCSLMRITNKNRRSNIVVTHNLKCVLRVERGDDLHMDPKTGRRKLFDIVMQTPVHILSCRCNPEWSSLPRYSESFDGNSTVVPRCPCIIARHEEESMRDSRAQADMARSTSRHSTDSDASVAETDSAILSSLHRNNVLFTQSTQYERLISGQESEIGEAPPKYTSTARIP